MIRYETKENKYYYNEKDLENILNTIKSIDFYNPNNCTQEKVNSVIEIINVFLKNIKTEEISVIKEKHETEEQAREYFGEDFINKFDKLMTVLDKQQTIVALHGTDLINCSSISENGLLYKSPDLHSTAILQETEYGKKDINYLNYETLLNWPHKQYKGIVIIAVPYECFYKEGLWNHFQKKDNDSREYKIDPDFIVGYIDVNNKSIIMNKKYNRVHNYTNYVRDKEFSTVKNGISNETAIKEAQKNMLEIQKITTNNSYTTFNDDIEDLPNLILQDLN